MSCKDCHWFKPDDNPAIPFGECRRMAVSRDGGPHYGESMAFPMPTEGVPARMPALTLAVYPDFGCVQFKTPDELRP